MKKMTPLKALLFTSLTMIIALPAFAGPDGRCSIELAALSKLGDERVWEMETVIVRREQDVLRIYDKQTKREEGVALNLKLIGTEVEDVQSQGSVVMLNTKSGISNYIFVYNRDLQTLQYFNVRELVEARDNNLAAKLVNPKSWFNSFHRINWSWKHNALLSLDGSRILISYTTLEEDIRTLFINL